jgi:hypothetical protein
MAIPAPLPYWMDQPTAYLRYVDRDGERVLQQRWVVTHYDVHHRATGQFDEWRDVPFETELEE